MRKIMNIAVHELSKTIGKKIKKLRRLREIKAETLAKELGVTKGYISQMESGDVDFKITALATIASVLKTSILELLDGGHCTESVLDEYSIKNGGYLRTINFLVCRMEYMHDQIECMRSKKLN